MSLSMLGVILDLETFWSEEGLSGLPKGVIESLRKVTPSNGLLSFERFCAGLKICLLRYQCEQQKFEIKLPERSPSAPVLDVERCSAPNIPPPIHPRSPTATVRPNNAMLHSRAISLPQLIANPPQEDGEPPPPVPVHMRKPDASSAIRERRAGVQSVYGNMQMLRNTPTLPQAPMMGPPKPPRAVQNSSPQNNVITNGALMMRTRSEINMRPSSMKDPVVAEKSQLPIASVTERAIAKAEVRTALQQWQLAQMDSEKNSATKTLTSSATKRRENRRHTLQSGIDQSMLRRIHFMEQERQVLSNGLDAIDRAQDWFKSQLKNVQERIRSSGKLSANDYSLDAQQERLGFKIARIEEVSRQLMLLIENADRGFPVHMNLALADPNKIHKVVGDSSHDTNDEEVLRSLRRLKSQNHQLTEEVGRKSERITMLEKEKSSLIRELFSARSQQPSRMNGPIPDDNTLM